MKYYLLSEISRIKKREVTEQPQAQGTVYRNYDPGDEALGQATLPS